MKITHSILYIERKKKKIDSETYIFYYHIISLALPKPKYISKMKTSPPALHRKAYAKSVFHHFCVDFAVVGCPFNNTYKGFNLIEFWFNDK